MLKLKLQYFGHLMGRADSLEKTLILGKIEGRRRRGQQRMRWLDGVTDSVDKNLTGGSHRERSRALKAGCKLQMTVDAQGKAIPLWGYSVAPSKRGVPPGPHFPISAWKS